ncbi:MAG: flagellar hook-length control protein FliK, partial [Pseudomonadota bacterium]
LPTAEAPTGAKARDVAVRTAAQGPVEAAEARPDDAKVGADTPDFTVQSETRASGTSSSAPAGESAHPVRGAPETVANLAAQIIKKLDARTTRFDVELDPHGLGKVDVRVEIGANGRITAAMTFDNPQAAQDVKARANELQRALEQAGFDMQGGALSFDVAQERGQGGQGRAWQDQNETGTTFRGQAFRAALETAGDAANAANQGALRLSRGVRTGLDVRI